MDFEFGDVLKRTTITDHGADSECRLVYIRESKVRPGDRFHGIVIVPSIDVASWEEYPIGYKYVGTLKYWAKDETWPS